MAAITTRETGTTGVGGVTRKNLPLTNSEIDTNFINLNTGKLEASNNLSDLGSNSTARTNLGLGTIATQAANSVSITGGSITGITDLALADGGTGASDAATARTNLGLAIGTNVQAFSNQLSSLASVSSNGIIARNGTNSLTSRTIVSGGTGISISDGDGVNGNPTISNTGVTSVNGSTGAVTVTVTAKGGGTDQIFWENDVFINSSYTIPLNKNAMTAGPVTVGNDAIITIQDGSSWTIT
jgi:hypothetical protein